MAPPEDAEAITAEGGVRKVVLAPGSGDSPCAHARCLVHYVGYLAASGEVFMDTQKDTDSGEPAILVAGRDSSLREVGLQLALARMRKGERAAVYITDPAFGYGSRGSFSFPSVPPAAQLVYDVQLLEWEPPEEKLDRRAMLFEERLEAAERRRADGNRLFHEGKLPEALGKYALALSYTDEDFCLQLEGAHLDKANAVMVPVYLNTAAAHLKLGDYGAAIQNCAQVLGRDKDNVKALFRRGRARVALGQTESAIADFERVAALAPDDKAVVRELHAARLELKKERAASAKMFKGAFGAPPPPRPAGEGRGGGGGTQGHSGEMTRTVTGRHHGLVAMLLGSVWALLARLVSTIQRLAGGRLM